MGHSLREIIERSNVASQNLVLRHVVPALRITSCDAVGVDFRVIRRDIVQIRAEAGGVRLFKGGDLGRMRKHRLLRKADAAVDAFVLKKVHEQSHRIGVG